MRHFTKSLLLLVLLSVLVACPQIDTQPPGWAVDWKVGTVNVAPSFANQPPARLQSSTQRLETLITRFTGHQVRIPTQATLQATGSSVVGINFFTQIAYNDQAPTQNLALQFRGPTGIIHDVDATPDSFDYEAQDRWSDYPLNLAQGNGDYSLRADVPGGIMSSTKNINLDALPLLGTINQVQASATKNDILATWNAVDGAKAYLILVENSTTNELIGVAATRTNSLDVNNATLLENQNYALTVAAFSYDFLANRKEAYPTLTDPVNISIARGYMTVGTPRLTLNLPTRLDNNGNIITVPFSFAGYLNETLTSQGITFYNYGTGPLRYSVEIDPGDHGVIMQGSSTGILAPFASSGQEIRFTKTCSTQENAKNVGITLHSNDTTQPDKRFSVLFECLKKYTYTRQWRQLAGSSSPLSITLSSDGTRVYTAGYDGLHAWDVAQGKIINSYSAGLVDFYQWILLSPDNKVLLTSKGSLLKADTFELIRNISNGYTYDKWAWSPNSTYLAASGVSLTAGAIFDATTGTVVRNLPSLNSAFDYIVWSPDGKMLAASSTGINGNTGGGYIRIWDTATGDIIRDVATQPAPGFAWNTSSTQVLTRQFIPPANQGDPTINRLVAWSVNDGQERFNQVLPDPPYSPTWNGWTWVKIWDETTNYLWFSDGTVWDTAHSISISTLRDAKASHGGGYAEISFNQMAHSAAYTFSDSGITSIDLFDLRTVKSQKTLQSDSTSIKSIDLRLDNTQFLTVQGANAKIYNIDGSLSQQIANAVPNNRAQYFAKWSPDGSRFAVMFDDPNYSDSNLSIWTVASQNQIGPVTFTGKPRSLAWGPDGQSVYASTSNQLVAFNAKDGTPLWSQLRGGDLALSPDGKTIAYGTSLGGNSSLEIRNASDGNLQRTLDLGFPSMGGAKPAWNSSGTKLIGFTSAIIRLFDTNTWSEISTANFATWAQSGLQILGDLQFVSLDGIPAGTAGYQWRTVSLGTGTQISKIDPVGVSCINGCQLAVSKDATYMVLARDGSGLEVWKQNP